MGFIEGHAFLAHLGARFFGVFAQVLLDILVKPGFPFLVGLVANRLFFFLSKLIKLHFGDLAAQHFLLHKIGDHRLIIGGAGNIAIVDKAGHQQIGIALQDLFIVYLGQHAAAAFGGKGKGSQQHQRDQKCGYTFKHRVSSSLS